ncbi:MAG: alcohol dehydrogenase catalytic domain-containing protein, partial [Acidiferrobacterales bacterium]|nr:alcohol dehydrogenase catalytic domain-containing protein [Acidiferrobacterales bacterium]
MSRLIASRGVLVCLNSIYECLHTYTGGDVSSMLSAYLVEPRKIELREVPEPRPQAGEVVIRVERALTCGTDLKAYRRGHPFIPMPGPFGHQYAGRVSRVGSDVREFEPDMPVWGVQSAPCGQCTACARARYSLCAALQRDLAFGAFAQFMRLPRRVVEQNLLVRPDAVSPQRAAFLEPVSCVIHGLNRLNLERVERILVLGLGSMGLLFCQLLPRFSEASIVAAGRNASRVAIAGHYDLERVLDVAQSPVERLSVESSGFDCIIECTGQAAGWHSALKVVRPGGQILFFGGLPKGEMLELDSVQIHDPEITLLGSCHFGPPDGRHAAELLVGDELRVDDLVSGEMALAQLDFALRQMEAGKGIKYAIDP